MINAAQIGEILSLYKKHGWTLRRVLLTENLKNSLSASLETLFGAAEIFKAEIDAAWFSRAAGGRETWEIRHLSETPFALLEIFEADDGEEIREEARRKLETAIKEKAARK